MQLYSTSFLKTINSNYKRIFRSCLHPYLTLSAYPTKWPNTLKYSLVPFFNIRKLIWLIIYLDLLSLLIFLILLLFLVCLLTLKLSINIKHLCLFFHSLPILTDFVELMYAQQKINKCYGIILFKDSAKNRVIYGRFTYTKSYWKFRWFSSL